MQALASMMLVLSMLFRYTEIAKMLEGSDAFKYNVNREKKGNGSAYLRAGKLNKPLFAADGK